MSDRLAMAERLAEVRELEQLRSENARLKRKVGALEDHVNRCEGYISQLRASSMSVERYALGLMNDQRSVSFQDALMMQQLGSSRSIPPLSGAFGAGWR